MSIDAPHRESVWKLAESVRSGELPAADLLDTQLERIGRHNASLGAFVFLDEARARTRATAIDAQIAQGHDPGPLAGVPFGVKVLEDVEGWPHTMAAKIFEDRIATTTSTQVQRLIRAGAIPIGLTASPEMGTASHTSSLLYGICRNPWNPPLTPGGSSGGSAAAVAAGLVPFATGSDSGGSLRIPAAYCGLFGFKGTYGRVPRGPLYVGFPNLRNYGVVTRSVRDCARILDTTAGQDERDPLSLPHPGPRFETHLDPLELEGLKVAWTPGLGLAPCDPEIEVAARDASERLIDALGWQERSFGTPIPSAELAWRVLGTPDMLGVYGPHLADQSELVAPFIRAIAKQGAKLTAADFGAAAQNREALIQALAEVFDRVDLILLPTVSCPAFAAEGPGPTCVGGQDVSVLESVAQTYIFNLSGHPAASVPIGRVGGAPVALQIVGRRHEDLRVLRAAAAWESLAPWPILAPDYER